ncbi:ABC transporter permease, partial [Coprococcus catus]
LLRNHALRGVFEEMSNQNFPSEVIEAIKDSVDCNLYFFGTQVSESMMYMILVGTVLLLLVIYVLLNMLHGTKEK